MRQTLGLLLVIFFAVSPLAATAQDLSIVDSSGLVRLVYEGKAPLRVSVETTSPVERCLLVNKNGLSESIEGEKGPEGCVFSAVLSGFWELVVEPSGAQVQAVKAN